MAHPISETLDSAQRALIALTGQRVSQTELQRLSWRLEAGDTPTHAAAWVQGFFALHDAATEAARMVEPGAMGCPSRLRSPLRSPWRAVWLCPLIH